MENSHNTDNAKMHLLAFHSFVIDIVCRIRLRGKKEYQTSKHLKLSETLFIMNLILFDMNKFNKLK